jgi:hypothetical protein
VVEQATVGQCKKADTLGEGEEASEPGGLLLEGEEQEYFLELLMRKASPEQPKASLPTKSKAAPSRVRRAEARRRRLTGRTWRGGLLTRK